VVLLLLPQGVALGWYVRPLQGQGAGVHLFEGALPYGWATAGPAYHGLLMDVNEPIAMLRILEDEAFP
jgi:hypothetical protein